jgi:uncharacterized membrane protein
MEGLLILACIGILIWSVRSQNKIAHQMTLLEERLQQTKSGAQHVDLPAQASTVESNFSTQQTVTHVFEDKITMHQGIPVAPIPSLTRDRSRVVPHTMQGTNHMAEGVFMKWVKEDPLMKFGALFLLLGVGWFVTYAIQEGWIGPVGRITVGMLMGVFLLILGAWRIRTYEYQGAIFTVLGSTIMIIVSNVGRFPPHQFFNEYSALGLTFLSVVFVAFVSLKYERNSLAVASLILAFLAPLFSQVYEKGINEFFSYILVVILGTLWVVYRTRWRNLTLIAAVVTFIFSLGYMEGSHDQTSLALLWVFVFTGIFFIANIVSLLRQEGGLVSEANFASAFTNALFLVVWVLAAAPQELQSLLFVAWALVFSLGSYIMYRSTHIRAPFYVYGSTAIALIGTATAAELSGLALGIALSFEIAALIVAATLMRMSQAAISVFSSLFLFPIFLSFQSMISPEWHTGVLHGDFFFLLILTLILWIVGLLVHEHTPPELRSEASTGKILITTGSLYALLLIWLVAGALFTYAIAVSVSLIMYVCIGIVLYFYGKHTDSKELKNAGALLLGCVIARLLIVDVWTLNMTGKIVTFTVIGVLLLSTAFLQRRTVSQ